MSASSICSYAAYAHSLKGDNALALIMLEDMELGSEAPVFTDYVLLKGKLLIENLAYDDALDLFSEYLRHPDMGETTQVVYFLSALCHQGLDNIAQAQTLLQDAIEIDSTSEYGACRPTHDEKPVRVKGLPPPGQPLAHELLQRSG